MPKRCDLRDAIAQDWILQLSEGWGDSDEDIFKIRMSLSGRGSSGYLDLERGLTSWLRKK